MIVSLEAIQHLKLIQLTTTAASKAIEMYFSP